MQRILFVRAVNVGGATLPMASFRELLSRLGATRVVTLIASGNAVVEIEASSAADAASFDRRVEASITDQFGFAREVISRSADEVAAALVEHPFTVEDAARSYVCFLDRMPTPTAVAAAGAVKTGADRWALGARDLHLRFAAGAGRADLDLNRLLASLGAIGTARNLRTVERVRDLAIAAANSATNSTER